LEGDWPQARGQTGAANAGGLIDAGKITVILDGLDEIAGRTAGRSAAAVR
jgi:hypothetical protein